MPEQRLQRARQTLPTDYQFGDARWRHPSQNAAEQLERRAVRGRSGATFLFERDADADRFRELTTTKR